jgi:hypothetical protein
VWERRGGGGGGDWHRPGGVQVELCLVHLSYKVRMLGPSLAIDAHIRTPKLPWNAWYCASRLLAFHVWFDENTPLPTIPNPLPCLGGLLVNT